MPARGALAISLLAVATLGGGDPLKGVLDAFERRVAAVHDLRARFVQTSFIASLGREETSRGRLYYLRPGRLRWEVEEPEPQVLVIDGKALRIFNPEDRVLQIAPLSGESMSQTALGFLFGEADLRRSFEIERIPTGERTLPANGAARSAKETRSSTERDGAGPEADREGIALRLTPKTDAGFERLEALLDAEALTVSELTIFDVLGNRTHLILEDLEENVGLGEENFIIRVPEDIEVIDLR